MTKTEAAKTIAIQVRVWARRTSQPITMTMVEEILSEFGGHRGDGLQIQTAANLANRKTVLRLALEDF